MHLNGFFSLIRYWCPQWNVMDSKLFEMNVYTHTIPSSEREHVRKHENSENRESNKNTIIIQDYEIRLLRPPLLLLDHRWFGVLIFILTFQRLFFGLFGFTFEQRKFMYVYRGEWMCALKYANIKVEKQEQPNQTKHLPCSQAKKKKNNNTETNAVSFDYNRIIRIKSKKKKSNTMKKKKKNELNEKKRPWHNDTYRFYLCMPSENNRLRLCI